MVAVLEVNYQKIFNSLVGRCIFTRDDFLRKGYYLNFRVGENTYYKAVWFDYNSKQNDKVIIRRPDGFYRNIYLSKVKGVSIYFNDPIFADCFSSGDDVSLTNLKFTVQGEKVKLEDFCILLDMFEIEEDVEDTNLIYIDARYDGSNYSFVMEKNLYFSFNFSSELYKCYRCLKGIYTTLSKCLNLKVSDFNTKLQSEMKLNSNLSNKIEFLN